mmetsp:Transcript_29318/g.68244  ORF Transcript_29318/g.68244 Transcript_29318/m.68244 type:complete len:153 (+) Transcript_29318:103-561(+)
MVKVAIATIVAALCCSADAFVAPGQGSQGQLLNQQLAQVNGKAAQANYQSSESSAAPWMVNLAAGLALGLVVGVALPAHAEEAKIETKTGVNVVKGNNRVANRPYGFLKEDDPSVQVKLESKLEAKLGDLSKYNARLFDKDKEDTMWSQAYK